MITECGLRPRGMRDGYIKTNQVSELSIIIIIIIIIIIYQLYAGYLQLHITNNVSRVYTLADIL